MYEKTDETSPGVLILTVPEGENPVRIDKYIADRTDRLSRSRIQSLIGQNAILLNQQPISRVSEKVKPGDSITIALPPPIPSGVLPEPIEIEILYEDQDILVVNKPAGMCVHPAGAIISGTLVNALLFHTKDLSGIGGVVRPGIVHRLDRGTSGVLLVAKNDEAHARLSTDFKSRRIKKVYWALIHGQPKTVTGEIDLPIGRHPSDRMRMAIRPDGRKSLTRYHILRVGLGGSLMEVYPFTGRTHQIRVHFKHLGFSIVRDVLYGSKKKLGRGELERLFDQYPGFALHAKSLQFDHPITGESMTVEASLPARFESAVKRLIPR